MSNFTKLAEHFEQYCYEYLPPSRVECAVKLASIDPLGASQYPRLASYSGQIPRPFEKISGLQAREGYVPDEGRQALQDLQKIAREMTPYELEAVLTEFDSTFKLAQYNYYPNPHETVFYPLGTKIAERWTGGTDTVTDEDLVKFLHSDNAYHVAERFSQDVLEGLQSDPWPVFLSLPEPSKNIISRMVNGHK